MYVESDERTRSNEQIKLQNLMYVEPDERSGSNEPIKLKNVGLL